jgi:hypothetical protein
MSLSVPVPPQSVITRHESAVYPAMAMLTGMKLDVFTPLKDGPLTSTEIAGAIGVKSAKLVPLLYALVTADLLTVRGDRFSISMRLQQASSWHASTTCRPSDTCWTLAQALVAFRSAPPAVVPILE